MFCQHLTDILSFDMSNCHSNFYSGHVSRGSSDHMVDDRIALLVNQTIESGVELRIWNFYRIINSAQ